MVAEGAMEGVDALYGAHVWSTLEAPYVDVSAGNRMACCHSFTIEVDGMTAHASAPHLGKDAISIAAAIINNLQQCVSRMNDPLNPLVLTIGTIQGGVRWNCTAGKCVMEGTIRTFAQGTLVEDQMRKIVSSTAEAFGAKAAITRYDYMTDPVINQSEMMCRIGREAITKLYGAECIANLPTMMGSEDFSVLSCGKIPYLFAFVGSLNKEKGIGLDPETGAVYSNHHEKYDMDEDALHRASAVAAQIAADFLAQNA
jgi:amidohydrolase